MTNKQSMHILYEVNLHNSEVKKLIFFQLNFLRKKKDSKSSIYGLAVFFPNTFFAFQNENMDAKKKFASKHLIYKLF